MIDISRLNYADILKKVATGSAVLSTVMLPFDLWKHLAILGVINGAVVGFAASKLLTKWTKGVL